MVIRDHAGRVTAALSKIVHQPLGPLDIEAKAMEKGVTFAWDVGIRDLNFEGDSKIVSNALMGMGSSPVAVSNILTGVSQRLQGFRLVKVSYVMRQGNSSAHILASYAKKVLNSDDNVIWIEKNPTLIKSNLAQDVLNLSFSQ